MFTGLIEAVSRIAQIGRQGDSMKISVELGPLCADCAPGDSIAINGVCLTITSITGTIAAFDVSGETLSKSTFPKLAPSTFVNIERAMKADGRFGGHFVQGHIDGTARIENVNRSGEFWTIRLAAAPDLLEQMVFKGSVAVDGISLTVAAIDKLGFEIAVIPQTIKKTNLQNARAGDIVNIETDVIVKVVKKQLQNILPQAGRVTVEKLKELGF
ncbi:MAG: riboflavin synthase [Phycisphaerae bacterium]|jgi:riboflavin synthase